MRIVKHGSGAPDCFPLLRPKPRLQIQNTFLRQARSCLLQAVNCPCYDDKGEDGRSRQTEAI